MGLNHKSDRIRSWCDQLHMKTEMHRPDFEKCIRLLTYIPGETISPRYFNYVKKELGKVLAQHTDLSVEQLKILGTLQSKLDAKFMLIQDRAAKRADRKAKKKEEVKAAEAPAQEATTPWD